MKLNSFTDYSLRVLIYLSISKNEKSTVAEISESYEISNNHLVKVVHNLSKLGLIKSFKGRGGGVSLNCDPKDIIVGELVMNLESDSVLVDCFGSDSSCKLKASCKLKSVLQKAKKSFYQVLNQYTLEDITRNKDFLRGELLNDLSIRKKEPRNFS